jgi:hypothetical protein
MVQILPKKLLWERAMIRVECCEGEERILLGVVK